MLRGTSIIFCGLIFTFIYNFYASTLRALGDSRSPLYFLMISAALNVAGDLFFVVVLGWGSKRMCLFDGAKRGTLLSAVRAIY